jgi:hypothetical protein
MNRNELGHGLSVLCDNNALLVNLVKQRQTLLLELGGGDTLHNENHTTGQKSCLATESGHYDKIPSAPPFFALNYNSFIIEPFSCLRRIANEKLVQFDLSSPALSARR